MVSIFSVPEVGSINVVTSTIDEEKKEAEQYVKHLTDKMHEHHVRFFVPSAKGKYCSCSVYYSELDNRESSTMANHS